MEDNTRLKECVEAWGNIISYVSGIALMLCGLYDAPKEWIIGLGIVLILCGNSEIKTNRILSFIVLIIIDIYATISVKLMVRRMDKPE